VQRTAARAGVRRMTPHELGLEMNNPAQALDSSSEDSRMRSRLEDKVDLETLRKLERLRRPDQ
jgi:predicted RNA-binding protein with PIN domain